MSGSRFVVRRRNWRWAPGNEHTPRGWVCFPGPGAEVAGFESFDAAETDRAQREAAVRLKMNPFECGLLPAVTTLPDPILRDFLMDAGVEPPAAGVSWADWWTANRPALPHEHQARVWQAADVVRFFEVTEEPDAPQVHVVVDVTWEEREGVHVAECDGGELICACRSLKRAGEVARGRANQRRITLAGQLAVDSAPFADCRPSHVPDPFAPGSTRLLRLPRASFCEVVTVPFDDSGDGMSPQTERVAVVVRHDYAPRTDGFYWHSGDAGVPIKAFAEWGKAECYAIDLERSARARINPFEVGGRPEELVFNASQIRMPELAQAMAIPVTRVDKWAAWWGEHVAPLPRPKRDRFWQQLSLRFYTVLSLAHED